MIAAIATGIVFGLSAGLAPGPLMALVISQSVRHGATDGIKVAIAPLLTDLPIVVLAALLVGRISAGSTVIPGIISVVGAAFVAWIAADTFRSRAPASGDEEVAVPHSVARGVTVNLLSPHPYLFWLSVGAPTLVAAWAVSPAAAAAFLVAFYGCLVGSKITLAILASSARGQLAGRRYTWLMRVLGVLLAIFAAGLLVEGLGLLGR